MKTAMQELIEKSKALQKILEKEDSIVLAAALYAGQRMAEELLEKEKQQIIDATKNGISHGYTEGVVFGTNPRDYILKWSESYYNETYKAK